MNSGKITLFIGIISWGKLWLSIQKGLIKTDFNFFESNGLKKAIVKGKHIALRKTTFSGLHQLKTNGDTIGYFYRSSTLFPRGHLR